MAAPATSSAEGIEGEANPNSYECSGHLKAGAAETEVEEGTAIQYSFACNGPITGYQIESQLPVTFASGSPVATNGNGEALGDALSCSTEIPGYAVNCVGTQGTTAGYQELTGEFFISSGLCQAPREDAILTVTYAYLEKGVITQAISGPYDLGTPEGCPKSKHRVPKRLEAEPVTEAEKTAEQTKKAETKLKKLEKQLKEAQAGGTTGKSSKSKKSSKSSS